MNRNSNSYSKVRYKWYALKVKSGNESYAIKEIARKVVREGKNYLFERILLPTKALLSINRDKKYLVSKSFFPGYVFIRMIACEESLTIFKDIPEVLKFAGGDIPGEVSEAVITNLTRNSYSSNLTPERIVSFKINESVRIVKGPFSNQDGVINKIDCSKNKISVSIPVFGRLVKIELNFNEVEKN